MNSLQVQRMLRHFNEAHKAEEASEPKPKAVRAPRQKKEAPPPVASDSMEDSGSDSGSDGYGEYKEVHEIKQHFEKEPCEYISPAALGQATTKKEAVEYLQSKKCPKVDRVKKSAAKSTMESGPVSPLPPAAPVKKVRKPKVEAAPAPAPEPVASAPAPKVKKVKAVAAAAAPAPAPAPPAAAPAAAKAKRPASEYAKLVGKYIKEQKLSLGDAAKKAKADLDAKKSA